MIDDAPKAKALARAICSDIALTHANVKEAPLDQRAGLLAGPLKEGHELFFSRVTPALASVFDEAIASILTPLMGVELKSLAPPRPPAPSPALGRPIVESGGSNKTLGVVVAIALLGAAAAFFFLRGH